MIRLLWVETARTFRDDLLDQQNGFFYFIVVAFRKQAARREFAKAKTAPFRVPFCFLSLQVGLVCHQTAGGLVA